MRSSGILLCLASAAAFGAMGIFGKLAYDEGATVGTLLAVRFSLAASLFWALAAATGAIRRLRALPRRDLGIALALGALGYSAQAGCYFAALQRLDASLLSLRPLHLPGDRHGRRDRARPRAGEPPLGARRLCSSRWAWCSCWPGAATGALDPLGTALGLAAAVVYATYILTLGGRRGARRPAPAERARVHGRGRHAHAGRRRDRRSAPGRT